MKRALTIAALVLASFVGVLYCVIDIFVRRFQVRWDHWDEDPLASPLEGVSTLG